MTRVALVWIGNHVERVCESRDAAEEWVEEYGQRVDRDFNIVTRDIYEVDE